jgi:Do/DeqQ family serine protease
MKHPTRLAPLVALALVAAAAPLPAAEVGIDPERGVLSLAPALSPIMAGVVQIVVDLDGGGDQQTEGGASPWPPKGPGIPGLPPGLGKPQQFGRPQPPFGQPQQPFDQPRPPFGEPEPPFDREPPQQRPRRSTGSGVIVDAARGLILTNHHVVEEGSRIRVKLSDGRVLEAQRIGTDSATDIGLLQVKAENLIAVPFGDSEALQVGDLVVAIGYPFALEQTVTMGIVSGLGRAGGPELGLDYADFIQTDAAINPGNSGGALVDTRGRLVGINTAIYSRQGGGNIGIGYAVPSRIARSVMEQLITFGEVRRGRLGVTIRDFTAEIAQALNIPHRGGGALITQVSEGSPGAQAGLKAGDIVIRVNDQRIDDSRDLKNAVGLSRPDAQLTLVVLRDGKEQTIEVRMEVQVVAAGALRLFGAAVGPLPADNPMAKFVKGVLVTDIETDGPAARQGVRKGDIITHFNRREVTTVAALKAELDKQPTVTALTMVRGNSEFIVVFERPAG